MVASEVGDVCELCLFLVIILRVYEFKQSRFSFIKRGSVSIPFLPPSCQIKSFLSAPLLKDSYAERSFWSAPLLKNIYVERSGPETLDFG